MPIWKLEPVNLESPQWATSYYRGTLIVRARDEARAREIPAIGLRQMTRALPRADTPLSVWQDVEVVTCTRLEDSEFDEDGPDAILDPPQYDRMFREMESPDQFADLDAPVPEVIVYAEGPVMGRHAAGAKKAVKSRELGTVVEQDEAGPVNVTVTPAAGQIDISRERPTLRVEPGPGLTADPGDRIRLSDTDAVPVSAVSKQHGESLDKLERLKATLDQFHGIDAPDISGARNSQEVPLSEDDMHLLRAVVASAINLHAAPAFPNRIKNALRELYEILDEFNRVIKKASETTGSLGGLAAKLGAAVLALKELLDILGGTN